MLSSRCARTALVWGFMCGCVGVFADDAAVILVVWWCHGVRWVLAQ